METNTLSEYKIVKMPSTIEAKQIKTSDEAQKFARQFFYEDIEIYESVFLITLDRINNTQGFVKISQGGISGTVVDIRLICHYALRALSTGIIIVHNHPTGSVKPSNQDITITKQISDALRLFEVKLLDHIILSPKIDVYYSLSDNGDFIK